MAGQSLQSERNMLRVCLILMIANIAMAQIPYLSTCPNVKAMPNFDPERFLGKWYEAERYFIIFQIGGKCVTGNYSDLGNGTVKIVHKQISYMTGVASSIEANAKIPDLSYASKMTVTFPNTFLPIDAPLLVLDTDYDTYMVLWTCVNIGVISVRYVWIMTREQNPPVSVLKQSYQTLDQNNISRAYLIRTDQKNCPVGN